MKKCVCTFASVVAVAFGLAGSPDTRTAFAQGGEPDGRPLQGRGPGMEQRSYMRMNPILVALDADHDGSVSAAELKGAPAALRSLDKNGDAQLTRDEVMPMFRRPGEQGRPGFEGRERSERRGGFEGRRGMEGGQRPEGREGAPQTSAPTADEQVKTLMAFDQNGDGKLSGSEVPERMQSLFERADSDKDGFLVPDELKKAAEAQISASGRGAGGPNRMGGRGPFGQDPVFAAIDLNSDGMLSDEEIKASETSLRKLDRNGDGVLGEDEVRPQMGEPRGRFNL